ncbi:MAG: PhnD/SsuA/transferrin family substrate-binding protein [Candidatus Magnetomorum sp.]|nr:PhnD/SsuA/transferrin family substrate-binding protein [Candidatus Magnetomorum sp.]
MKKSNRFVLVVIVILLLLNSPGIASQFKFGIMQDKKGAAAKFRPLLNYLKKHDIKASFISAKSYPDAARMFAMKQIDGMFSGSGIAGCMIVKNLAIPVVRPLNKAGWSTYWAVVLAPKGAPRFTQSSEYFKQKSVIFCSLASSGEFFFRSFKGSADICNKMMKAPSHFVAIDTLSRGIADVAIVKNRVWDDEKLKYPNVIRVGEDPGENPDGTLIVSKNTDPLTIENISTILLGLEKDHSTEAIAVKDTLNILGYIKTTENDFKFTIPLIKKAGVDPSFNFSF